MTDLTLRIALVGNPNTGKTALFNRLTGSRQKVANYAGVTVDRKIGFFSTPRGRRVCLLDLPGTYSLASRSPDEAVTAAILQGRHHEEPPPQAIVFVMDATNLRLHLRLLLEIRQLGLPVVVALNMVDQAARRGVHIDVNGLSRRLGMPVIETVAVRRDGAARLLAQLDEDMPPPDDLAAPPDLHHEVRAILSETVRQSACTMTWDDKIDRWALHPLIGPMILATVMFLSFQAVYAVGRPITEAIGDGMAWLGDSVTAWIGVGPLAGLIADGVCAGLGSLLGFLPQILALFFILLVLEESGYLPRAAFLLDRVMVAVGLSGRAFIPLLSSFACAIPSIIGARSIPDRRDRLVAILVAPLMTCAARLPVYTLLIGAFIPQRSVGIFNLQGVVLFALYAAGILGGMTVAMVGKLLRRHGDDTALLMELPPYRLPKWRDIALALWERAWVFLRRLTGVMLALSIVMWGIANFPAAPMDAARPAIESSFAGMLGLAMQPLFAPLGFNWQITLALIPAFAARESAVTTLATIYSVADGADSQLGNMLAANLATPTALALMVWFAFAPQCMSTLAVIRRETGDWRIVLLSFAYMFVLAYGAAFATYQLALRWL
ncbi:ferrous iron transporter B [Bordetella sp. 15P40C-2]|uniref:ferrous iron transporter B n=1 Tax=Bordetella sp. 15P40C-2 TaxID=2572246 RepID=UPI00132C7885|nr:ferrous iron transporter B [Bordetella sp. 15P40C-2]MVW70940.1 ferrous iron transporter B [Bordetella sp. 15P40C-2]